MEENSRLQKETIASEHPLEQESLSLKKRPKKKLLLIGGITLAIVIAVLALVLHKSEFEKVYDEVSQVDAQLTGGDDYFIIDTNPFDKPYDELELWQQFLFSDIQSSALEAIQLANDRLGFNGSLYTRMLDTTALMGRQTDETDRYEVSWTYHPDTGLEVTYEIK